MPTPLNSDISLLIVPDPDKAKKVLEKSGFTVRENSVVAVGVSDQPAGLSAALKVLNDAQINVEYLYAFVEKKAKKAVVVIRTENVDEAITILKQGGITVLSSEEVYNL